MILPHWRQSPSWPYCYRRGQLAHYAAGGKATPFARHHHGGWLFPPAKDGLDVNPTDWPVDLLKAHPHEGQYVPALMLQQYQSVYWLTSWFPSGRWCLHGRNLLLSEYFFASIARSTEQRLANNRQRHLPGLALVFCHSRTQLIFDAELFVKGLYALIYLLVYRLILSAGFAKQ
jgi:hypothetical protein